MKRTILPDSHYLGRLFTLYGLAAVSIGLAVLLAISLKYDPIHTLGGIVSFAAGILTARGIKSGVFASIWDRIITMAHHPIRVLQDS